MSRSKYSAQELAGLTLDELDSEGKEKEKEKDKATRGRYEVQSSGILLQVYATLEQAMNHYYGCQSNHCVVYECKGSQKWKICESHSLKRRTKPE